MASHFLVWPDDELESLVNTTVEQFGQDRLTAALDRGMLEVKKCVTNGEDVTGVFYTAVRTELRQLTRPH